MSSNPTFVFVPGLLHTPVHFGPLNAELAGRGFATVPISLPTTGDQAEQSEPERDIASIRSALEDLTSSQGKDVVLVCHSMGGLAGCQSVHGFDVASGARDKAAGGSVVGIVFLCSFAIKTGEVPAAVVSGMGEPTPIWFDHDATNPAILKANDNAKECLYGDLSPTEQDRWFAELRPSNAAKWVVPMGKAVWELDIPKLYFAATEDKAVTFPTQKQMYESLKDKTWSYKEIKSGHSPFLSHVKDTADALVDFARSQEVRGQQ